MAARIVLTLLLTICLSAWSAAQGDLSWKQHAKLAEQSMKEGKYAEAADHYEKAWRKRTKDKALIFNAGEAYYLSKDYRKAAEAYRNVKDENGKFPLVGLKYARSLKQDGQYEKAKQEFKSFYDSYTGDSKNILEEIIKVEIAGADLGMQLPKQMDASKKVMYLDGLNSGSPDFAPFAYSDDVLYLSSTQGGKARIYRSQRQGGQWSKASLPENFPVIQNNQHYSNSSLSQDGNRFYFTICSGAQGGTDIASRCEIFVLKRKGNTWAQPERLPDYINMDKATATHPNVVAQGNREILYFSSNREGGRGGMDLWYTSRDASNEKSEFSMPVNLGGTVNTLGDEITPFYDGVDGTLYFASNGHPSIGGYDIFMSKGDGTRWAEPVNGGMPLNSSADDYFFAQNKAGSGGFFVSNRVFGSQKTNTRDEDIFEYTTGERRISLRGNLYDQTTNAALTQASVSLFEMTSGGEKLIDTKNFADGAYVFDIQSGKNYKVKVESTNYTPYEFRFTADDPELYVYGQPVYMNKAGQTVAEKPVSTNPTNTNTKPNNTTNTKPTNIKPTTTPPANTKPKTDAATTSSGDPYIVRGKSKEDNFEIVTSAPRHDGVYYRIQLVAVKKYNPDAENFKTVKDMGTMQTEFIVDKKLTRVLVGDYFKPEEATAALDLVKQQGFANAFIVQYENGERFGQVKL